jgi:hypothetical protein
MSIGEIRAEGIAAGEAADRISDHYARAIEPRNRYDAARERFAAAVGEVVAAATAFDNTQEDLYQILASTENKEDVGTLRAFVSSTEGSSRVGDLPARASEVADHHEKVREATSAVSNQTDKVALTIISLAKKAEKALEVTNSVPISEELRERSITTASLASDLNDYSDGL